MRKLFVAVGCGAALLLAACSAEPARIVLGRDWNPTKQVVYDTASVFHVNAPVILQMYNGGEFGVDSVLMTVYRGSSASPAQKVFSRVVRVKTSESSLILKGRSAAPLTARGLIGASEAGVYTIEFSVNGSVQTSRQVELTRAQEK